MATPSQGPEQRTRCPYSAVLAGLAARRYTDKMSVMGDLSALMRFAAERAANYRDRVAELPVFPFAVDLEVLREALGPIPEGPTPADMVVRELADLVEPALVATTGPRYFGFVVGGVLDAPTAADVLTTGWDQVAFNAVSSPGTAVVEEVAGRWLIDLLGLPPSASFGFCTGAQAANTISLAAARHQVLHNAGWDVEQDGLVGAPKVRIVANGERHATVDRALRLLGFGVGALEPVATGEQGAIDIADLRRVLDEGRSAPTIVVLQAGNVNTGAFDDFTAAVELAHQQGAWVHVDGAFGLWAAASSQHRHLVAGVEAADSWGCDGHKWLNVPYDSGYAFCAHPDAHAAAMSYTAAYLAGQGEGPVRHPGDFVLESSRRARGIATYAAIRQLGRTGIAELVDGCCTLARRFAVALDGQPGVHVVNDVVLNQVLVRFDDSDTVTDEVIAAVQQSGVCWMGGTTWRGKRLMRIAVSSWRTTESDVDRSVDAILAAASKFIQRPT
jgi:glutamate/tyrosine decarboxylase-like PLP-dependent enzyme